MLLAPDPKVERVPLEGAASFAVREFRQAGFSYPWHQHREAELTLIVRGSGLRYVGDSAEPFAPGDLCLLGGGLPHAWRSPPGGRKGVYSIVVQFDPAVWGGAFLSLPEMRGVKRLVERAGRGLQFTGPARERAAAGLHRLVEEPPRRRLTAVLDLLQQLAEVRTARPLALGMWEQAGRPVGSRINAVLEQIHRRHAEPLIQAAFAREHHLSPAGFSRFFRRAIGKPFVAYVNDLRVGEACRRLLETDATVAEIAFGVGFGNLSNFNRCFRLARGVAPREFRRRAWGLRAESAPPAGRGRQN